MKKFGVIKNNTCQTNLYGRLSIGNGLVTPIGHTIELVSGGTARLIEMISKNQSIPYIVGMRSEWGRSYHMKQMENSLLSTKDAQQLFLNAANDVEKKRNQIEELSTKLYEIGISSLCLEFVIENNQLIFIDWDTEDDRKVLNRIL